jgi:hypothetical protein
MKKSTFMEGALHSLFSSEEVQGDRLVVGRTFARETIAAIHRLIASGLEWDLCRLAACAARDVKHFATAAAIRAPRSAETTSAAFGGFTRRTAVWAAIGLILKAFTREELLFSGAESEFHTAIRAGQFFIDIQASLLVLVNGFDSLRT